MNNENTHLPGMDFRSHMTPGNNILHPHLGKHDSRFFNYDFKCVSRVNYYYGCKHKRVLKNLFFRAAHFAVVILIFPRKSYYKQSELEIR